jgi:hypothetical protein
MMSFIRESLKKFVASRSRVFGFFMAVTLSFFVLFQNCSQRSDVNLKDFSSLNEANATSTLSGKIQLGPVKNASIVANCILPDGSLSSEEIGKVKSYENGFFTIQLKSNTSCYAEITSSGGEYVEESSGLQIVLPENSILKTIAYIDNSKVVQLLPTISINSLSDMVVKRFHVQIEERLKLTVIGGNANGYEILRSSLESANNEISHLVGFQLGTEVNAEWPSDPLYPSSDPESISNKFAIILAGISQIAKENALTSFEVGKAFADDVVDGVMNDDRWMTIASKGQVWVNDPQRNSGGFVYPNSGFFVTQNVNFNAGPLPPLAPVIELPPEVCPPPPLETPLKEVSALFNVGYLNYEAGTADPSTLYLSDKTTLQSVNKNIRFMLGQKHICGILNSDAESILNLVKKNGICNRPYSTSTKTTQLVVKLKDSLNSEEAIVLGTEKYSAGYLEICNGKQSELESLLVHRAFLAPVNCEDIKDLHLSTDALNSSVTASNKFTVVCSFAGQRIKLNLNSACDQTVSCATVDASDGLPKYSSTLSSFSCFDSLPLASNLFLEVVGLDSNDKMDPYNSPVSTKLNLIKAVISTTTTTMPSTTNAAGVCLNGNTNPPICTMAPACSTTIYGSCIAGGVQKSDQAQTCGNRTWTCGTSGASTGDVSCSMATGVVCDTTPPTVVSTSPTSNATNVAVNSNLVLNFSENVQVTGGIYLREDPDGTSSPRMFGNNEVTVSGSTITINPSTDLEFGKTYLVDGYSNVQDLAGNRFDGLPKGTPYSTTSAGIILRFTTVAAP